MSAAKTAVSLLQELCMRRGISPKYDLLQTEGPVHEPTFVYRVTVGEFSANGSGHTKKKAKHSTAKTVLDMIVQGGGAGGQEVTDIPTPVTSPYEDGIPGNPIGQLQEMCMTHKWSPPCYVISSENGFHQDQKFSVCCTIGSVKEIGVGRSKKLAKRQASNKMMQKLKEQPVDQIALNTMENNEQRRHWRNNKNSTVSSLMYEFVQMLQDIAHDRNFVVTYVEIEEKSMSGAYQCLVQLSTSPVSVCYGTGPTMKEAQAQAALNALEYLKILTKS